MSKQSGGKKVSKAAVTSGMTGGTSIQERNLKNDPQSGKFVRASGTPNTPKKKESFITPKTASVGFNVAGIGLGLRYSKRMGFGFYVKPTRSKSLWAKHDILESEESAVQAVHPKRRKR